MTFKQLVWVVAEDILSCAVVSKVIRHSGRNFEIDREINAHGYTEIKSKMRTFCSASHVYPHIVLTDLDTYECPLELIDDWEATNLPPRLMFRIAVKEVEAWLLADRYGIANFLHIAPNKVPQYPENEADPKRTLINLARRSRKKRLAWDIVPALGSVTKIGPFYNERLSDFVNNTWDINKAITRSSSLKRMVDRLNAFLVQET